MPLDTPTLLEIVSELQSKPGHEKVRALIHQLLVSGLGADSKDLVYEERMAEVHGRADALLGRTILEFKSDLERERSDARQGLLKYIKQREDTTGHRYFGIATDGLTFEMYERRGDAVRQVADPFHITPDHPQRILDWLETAIALQPELEPTPERMVLQLGRGSVAHQVATDQIRSAWDSAQNQPDAILRRELWSDLLTRVYGTPLDEEDEVFVQHTYLTIVAKAIAVRALDVPIPDAADLLSGEQFRLAGITGAVESDFFDWILHSPEGPDIVSKIAHQVNRFRMTDVQQDLLKPLYESLIDPAERHDLGEFYTPDWLAAWIIEHIVDDPLNQRVLDPACGSGTFLFHAVRHRLNAADDAGESKSRSLTDCVGNVMGLDVHPVAVIIARATYLLAIGFDRLREREPFAVPVYLGDALQWQTETIMGRTAVTIEVPDENLTLEYPAEIAEDPSILERTVDAMLQLSAQDEPAEAFSGWAEANTSLQVEVVDALTITYEQLRDLTSRGKDSIWAYVTRNLARPIWLSKESQRVDRLVGNPPWLSARYMNDRLHEQFKEEARELHVATGKAAARDLSAYFFARSVELYLQTDGKAAFVFPAAALSRSQFRGLRKGEFGKKFRKREGGRFASVRYDEVWDLMGVEPLFRIPACVLFATRGRSAEFPETKKLFTGLLQRRDAGVREARDRLRSDTVPATRQIGPPSSEFAAQFRQGCPLVPRMMFIVERETQGKLGGSYAQPQVRSSRSRQEKEPWKDLNSLAGSVEATFLRPFLLGASVNPYMLSEPVEAIVPLTDEGEVLDSSAAFREGFINLGQWLRSAEGLWERYGDKEEPLAEAIDYYRSLRVQAKPASVRVVYAVSGKYPSACIIRDESAVVGHELYWASVNEDGAYYLCAVLNSTPVLERLGALVSYGAFGERHIAKDVWQIPIPLYDGDEAVHVELSELAREGERVVQELDLGGLATTSRRKAIRKELSDSGLTRRVDAAVKRLLPE